MDRFAQFLKELATVLRFKSLEPDQYGACMVVMKESQLPLLFEYDERLIVDTILLTCPIMECHHDHLLIFSHSLKANASMIETLSWKRDEERIYMHRRFPPDIDKMALETSLDHFLTKADEIKGVLTQVQQMGSPYRDSPPIDRLRFKV